MITSRDVIRDKAGSDCSRSCPWLRFAQMRPITSSIARGDALYIPSSFHFERPASPQSPDHYESESPAILRCLQTLLDYKSKHGSNHQAV